MHNHLEEKTFKFVTTPGEAALTNLIFIHFIKGTKGAAFIIVAASLLLVFGLLFLFDETPRLEIAEQPAEAILIILGTFGSWMLMQFWSYRGMLKKSFGARWGVSMRLDSKGVHWQYEDGQDTLEWKLISHAKVFGSRLFLLPRSGGHIVIYRRAFTQPVELKAYAASVQAMIDASAT